MSDPAPSQPPGGGPGAALVLVINRDATIASVSPALQTLAQHAAGYRLTPGSQLFDYNLYDEAQVRKSLARCFEGRTVLGTAPQIFAASGDENAVEIVYTPLYSASDTCDQVQIIYTTLSETERLIADLRASQARFKAQYQSFPLATYTWQRQGDDFMLIDYNRAADLQTEGRVSSAVGQAASSIYAARPDLYTLLQESYRRMDVLRLETEYKPYTGGEARPYVVTFAFVPPNLVMQHMDDVSVKRQTEREYQALQVFHESLIEQMAEGLIVQAADGMIIFANRAAANLLGYSLDELLTLHWTALCPPDQQAIIRAQDAKRQQGRSTRYEVDLMRRDGERVQLLVSGSPRFYDGEYVGTMAIFADISALVHARQVEHEHRLLAETLIKIANAINSTLERDELLDLILDNMQQIVPHDAADIMLLEGTTAHIVRARGYEERSLDPVSSVSFALDTTPTLRTVLESGQPLVISDTRRYADWITLPESGWIMSHAAAPIRLKNQVFGLLNVDSATPGFFTDAHASHLQALADQVAIALHNAQLYTQIQRYTELLERRVDERTRALQEAAERATTILNSSSEALILVDSSGVIQQVNAVFEQTFGPHNPAVPRALVDVLGPATAIQVRAAFERAIRRGVAQYLEGRAQRATGEQFDVSITLAPVTQLGQAVTSVVCSLRDVSRRRQLEQKLRDMLERERELSELKSRFITTVSHEFRTPLAIIQTSGEMLTRYYERLTPDQRQEKMDLVVEGIDRIVSLLDSVLAFGESSARAARPDEIDLTALCTTVVADIESEARTPNRIVIEHQSPCATILLDSHLVYQIMYHLLRNAILYSTPTSPINLRTVCTPNQVILTIEDNGIGIPHHDQAALFEAFHRGSNVGHTSGTGLGLAIVKQAVDLLGGAIAFESDIATGTTFIVALPLGNESTDAAASPAPRQHP